MGKTSTSQSGEKVLDVLNVLLRNFALGYTPSELAAATKMSPSLITRCVATLEAKGFAERIPETGRIRASHRHAQFAVSIMKSLSDAQSRAQESMQRITKEV